MENKKEEYIRKIGIKTNIHKVSYFLKGNIRNKKILFIDMEFSKNKEIYEIGGFVIEERKVIDYIFREYSISKGEPIWDFDNKRFVEKNINRGKKKFLKKDKDWLFTLINSVDYVVMHNYVAEAQCLFKLEYPNEKYNINKVIGFAEGKFICTNYTFNNKYFKDLNYKDFTNSGISKAFGWKIKSKKNKYIIKSSSGPYFEIDKPKNVESKIHNSFYDSVITLTNYISASKYFYDI